MRLIAKKPCSYGGKKFFIGDEIPAELVVNIEREEKLGVISIANDEAGVPEQSGALYSQEQVDKMMADAVANASKGFTQEQVDEMIQSAVAELKPFDSDNAGFTVTVKGEGDNVTAVSCSAEDIQSVVDVLQMNADDGAKAVASVKSDSVLILLHALDTRATVKKAAQKQHDTLFSAEGNSNESAGGNATTDSNTEGDAPDNVRKDAMEVHVRMLECETEKMTELIQQARVYINSINGKSENGGKTNEK